MRRWLLVGGVAAALVLSACGATPAARKASLDAYVASLGASPDLQVTVTGSVSGPHTTSAEKVLKLLSVQMRLSSASGQALSQSAGAESSDVTVQIADTTLFDARETDSNLYLYVEPTALGKIPGFKVPGSELSLVQFAVGGRWFELPKSTLERYLPKRDAASAQLAEERSTETRLVDALTNVIDAAPYTVGVNGSYSETGTILSIERVLVRAMTGHAFAVPASGLGRGATYTLSISTSGAAATGASVSISAPVGAGKVKSASLDVAFAHADDAVTTPSGATDLTPGLIESLLGPQIAVKHVAVSSRIPTA